MKKILPIILVLTLLSGCTAVKETVPTEILPPVAEETAAEQPQVTVPTETEPEPEPAVSQQPMVAVSVPLIVDTVSSEDGTVIFRKTSQSMQLTVRDPDIADKIIIDFLNRVDTHSGTADSIRQDAEAAYTADADWNTYFYDLIYNPTRIDHGVLSLYGEEVTYSGGNHSQRLCTAANYNMVTGDTLTLGSILYHIDTKAALTDLVIESLDAIAEEKYLLDGYEDVVRARFNRDESFDEDWYFTDEGLCFYFAPYEIAPYASGVIVAQIPYDKLTGIIADEFFPAEEDHMAGNILASPFDGIDLDQFSQIAELNIDQDGDMFFLYTTGGVRNLYIQSGTIHDVTSEFTANATIFGTYTLTPGDAVMIKISLAEATGTLRLSYVSGDEQHYVFLTPDYLTG